MVHQAATDEIVHGLEALLFAADRPLDEPTLRGLLGDVGEIELEQALARLRRRHAPGESGIRLMRVAGGWQLRTAPELGDVVSRLHGAQPVQLSRAALETLAIVAYRQPLSRAEVEALRGVDSSGVLRSLLELGLVQVRGRRDTVGRPLIYGTDENFLSFFGIDSLEALPRLRELSELEQAHLFQPDEPESRS